MLISVRPENTHLTADSAHENTLDGKIVFVRDLGEILQCYVDCGFEDPVVVTGAGRDHGHVSQGDETTVFFPPEACVVVRP